MPQFGFFPSRWRPVPRSLSLDPPASPTLRSRSPYTNAWRTMKLVAELLRLLPTNTVPLLTADPKPGSSSAPSSEPWSVPTLVCAPTMPTTSAGQPSTRSANGHYEARARARFAPIMIRPRWLRVTRFTWLITEIHGARVRRGEGEER